MEEKTKIALEKSIAHWERMLMLSGDAVHNERPTASECPLCTLFLNPSQKTSSCLGCPVFEKTGLRHCIGSPYQDALSAYSQYFCRTNGSREEWHDAADKEISFLKSLLPD